MSKRSTTKPRSFGLEGMRPAAFRQHQVAIPRKALIEHRRAEAMQLRAAGMPLELIGYELHADSTMQPKGIGTPGGYGWRNLVEGKSPVEGKSLAHLVGTDINPQLERAQLSSEVARQQALELELYRLDMASAGIWPGVLQGRARDLEVWLKLSERRAKLLGLDKAEKVEVSGEQTVRVVEGVQPKYDSSFAQEMFDALRQAGALDETNMPELPGVIDIPADDVIEVQATEVVDDGDD